MQLWPRPSGLFLIQLDAADEATGGEVLPANLRQGATGPHKMAGLPGPGQGHAGARPNMKVLQKY